MSLQTRQLNIWGFVRTETLGGEKGGWQHDSFLRGRPDLLKGIERTEVKSASKKRSSVTKPQTSSRSTRRAAKNVNEFSDDNSCSSSQADSHADSQASLSSYNDNHAQVQNKDTAAIAPPVSQANQGSVLQYFDHTPVSSEIYDQFVQDSVSLSSSSSVHTCSDDTSALGANAQQVEEMYSIAQPFNRDDLMYLASIFEKDDQSDEDLSSILSLNQEASVEDYSFNL